ncbi:MAG: DNA polymerase III subunit gamma/tau [Planctomycetota bacterium]|nr:DNA polymerase III subunit gamma/tau [Planctomycetota bacterium]
MSSSPEPPSPDGNLSGSAYQVVARRYRPQSFESLVGQSQVSTALANAIRTDRVGHAYLFTGARGVGKTSSARIFAKCLNCEEGPTESPCGKCEVCAAVNDGQDVDVLEIDGASNRGIDEIRELRANINVRPSRSRHKVYIIDEVHMLTTQAFNALLKTLEEPPTHVKFIFCTTDPEKIPITVLSRCQRFDFAPVEADSIANRLSEICKNEGFDADEDALALLARRANGSMRDSQSLLEQLLSFCDQKITLQDVNQMLGTADLGSVQSIVEEVVNRDSQAALGHLDRAIGKGVDPSQLGSQLVGFFRDLLVVNQGCTKDLLLTANPSDFEEIRQLADRLGSETAMACLQVFDDCLTRMRSSSHARTLVEMAIIRSSNLENLDAVSSLIQQAKSGLELVIRGDQTPAAATAGSGTPARAITDDDSTDRAPVPDNPPAKNVSPEATVPPQNPPKKKQPADEVTPAEPESPRHVSSQNIEQIWRETLENVEDIVADYASQFESVAISAPKCLVVTLDSFYKEKCEAPSVKIKFEETFARLTRQRFRIDFVASNGKPVTEKKSMISKRQKMKELENHPMVRKAIETFDGEIVDVRSANQ